MSINCSFFIRLVTSYRTFHMYAETESEAEEWVRLIKSKLVCFERERERGEERIKERKNYYDFLYFVVG